MINIKNWTAYLGDCLEIMKSIPDGSIDAIIADIPYWTTKCSWDQVIPFEPMWEQLKRIIKPNGAIVLFGSEPFSSALRMSNIKQYKYDWVWEKERPTNIFWMKNAPWRVHENISVFSESKHNYHPIMGLTKNVAANKIRVRKWEEKMIEHIWWSMKPSNTYNPETIYPRSILKYSRWTRSKNNRFHPTQKPVALIEYLIRTYTNEWETVLDFTSGSGTTWIACQNTNRNYILIEKDEWYYEISKERLIKNKILLWS